MALYQKIIMFTYFGQAVHCILGAMHIHLLSLVISGDQIVANLICAGINAWAFVNNAKWRESLRARLSQTRRWW